MIKIATVFSGIGAYEESLKDLKIAYENVFACDNGERDLERTYKELNNEFLKSDFEEINSFISNEYKKTNKRNYVKETYLLNHDTLEWYDDIRFVDGFKYRKKIDVFVGGSPCQSFSIIGKRGGLNDTRGTLFFDFARLILEIQPKVFIFENVGGLLNHDKGKTWLTIQNVFNDLGYCWKMKQLNSVEFGIPQNRKRVFVVGFKDYNFCEKFEFPTGIPLDKNLFDFLDVDVDHKYYLGQKGFEFVTNEKYKNRARVNRNIIQTQKANQQFNWNGDFYFESSSSYLKRNKHLPKNAYESYYLNKLGIIRKLTPRELLRLMGFKDNFKIVDNDVKAYRQIGNSIVVNILKSINSKILNTGVLDK